MLNLASLVAVLRLIWQVKLPYYA